MKELRLLKHFSAVDSSSLIRIIQSREFLPKGDLWVQSPMIIVGQSPNIRSIAENRRRSTEAYRRVMSTWPSMMVGTAEGDLPKLFSPALLA